MIPLLVAMPNLGSCRDRGWWSVGIVLACAVISPWCGSIGCSRPPADIAPVSGRVTLAGQPLAGATVTFQPVRPATGEAVAVGGSVGTTDEDGRFVLRLIDPDVPGAAIGKHVVTITTAWVSGNDAARPTGEQVPVAWRDGSKTFDVPGLGTLNADFDLP